MTVNLKRSTYMQLLRISSSYVLEVLNIIHSEGKQSIIVIFKLGIEQGCDEHVYKGSDRKI